MNYYGKSSKRRLKTAHPYLQILFQSVLQDQDHSILEGHRSKGRQNRYFQNGRSRLPWPKGKHNKKPSLALDVAPYINGRISEKVSHCCYFAGLVIMKAKQLGLNIRWGGNWDGDEEVMTDQDFQDLYHFELII